MIDGETILKIKRQTESAITVDGLFKHLRPLLKGGHQKWTVDIHIWSLVYDEFKWQKLEDVVYHNIGEVFKINLASGKHISLTADHIIATPEEKWLMVTDLKKGSKVLTNGVPISVTTCIRCGGTKEKITQWPKAKFYGHCRKCARELTTKPKLERCIRCGDTKEKITQWFKAKFYGHCRKCSKELTFKPNPERVIGRGPQPKHYYPKVDEVASIEWHRDFYIYEIKMAEGTHKNFTGNGVVLGSG